MVGRGATLPQQVAALRLLALLLHCWQFQYPLTGEAGRGVLRPCTARQSLGHAEADRCRGALRTAVWCTP